MAAADPSGLMSIDIHDGEPWAPIWDGGTTKAIGNFMPGIDTWGYGFEVERIWFYHGGDYPDSGIPYQLHFIQRIRNGEEEIYDQLLYFDWETTCNYCWEELTLGYNVWDVGSDEDYTFGVFIRPYGGTAADRWPRLWLDQSPDHEQLAAVMNVWWPPPFSSRGAVGRDDPYSLRFYYSDAGLGEVLLGMEVSSDIITATEETSFSTIKSLYE